MHGLGRRWRIYTLLTLLVFMRVGRADLFGSKQTASAESDSGVVFNMHIRWDTREPLEAPYYDEDSVLVTHQMHYALPSLTPLVTPGRGGLYFSDSSLISTTPLFNLELSKLQTVVEMDPEAEYFTILQLFDGHPVAIPQVLSIQDYVDAQLKDRTRKAFVTTATRKLQAEAEAGAAQSFELIGADIAGQRVSLRVRGDININGNLTKNNQSQTATTANQYESTNFQIKQTQAFKIEGKVGDRVSINVDQDSERDFDFENSLQIHYNGTEDEIIQKVEAGNITLNLPATNLATFSSKSNGLFGLKAVMKVGALDITTIASLEKGQQQKKSFSGDEATQGQSIPDFRRVERKYFYINDFYRRKFYPLNEAGLHILTGRRVVDIEVYKSILPGSQFDDSEIYWGYARVDTQQIARNWVRLNQNQDYTILEDFGVIQLEQPVQTDEVLAIAYKDSALTDAGTLVYEYDPFGQTLIYQAGTLGEVSTTDTLHLEMLKSDDAQPGQPPWDLELKNVYYLGARPINKEGFELKIEYTRTSEPTEETAGGENFLGLFGLDLYDESGNLQSDGIVDLNNVNTISFTSGEVFLPYLHPFMPDTLPDDAIPERTDALGNILGTGGNPNLTDPQYQSFSFYNELQGTSNYEIDHKFQLAVKYSNKSSVINLGFNLIEGSEEVTLDGRRLQRGPDYQIDYFSGTLTILNESALAPGAQLEVKYEQHEFFQLDKKIILGSRAEYKFGKNEQSFIGATALFFSKSSIDEKVRIGKEPIQNFIWDVNTKMTYDMNWLTKALDWLPVIKTDKPSTLNIQGEVAQVRPNPNTANNVELGDYGVAYIDDFEGSRRETNLGIQMRNWTLASPPIDVGGSVISRTNRKRGYTYWYNPYHRIPTNQIWPNKETSAQAQNDVTDVLVLNMNPDSSFWVRNDHNDPTEAWGGFMRSLSSGYYDQTESKFLEMWVKGDAGRIHVDLGLISEDLQSGPAEQWSVTIDGKEVQKGWGRLDTEDLPSATSNLGDGLVSEAEDVGLDGWLYTHPDTLDWHPGWDLWEFDPNATPLDYSRANGGEGNFNAEGGRYPDTEDLNNNGALDTRNAYFTIDVDLSQDTYVAGRTQYLNGGYTGWKLIRVPLTEFDIAGDENSAKWEKIKYARLWLDGVEAETLLQIATLDLVGNEWQETAGVGVFSEYEHQDIAADTILTNFDVSVINTEDNPNRYSQDARDPYAAPPTGVRGVQDPITGLRSKEQSLVLKVENLLPGHAVSARKQFYDTKDMSHYGTLKMFIHGWDPDRPDYEAINNFSRYEVNSDSSTLEFFLRLTLNNQDDYYEIRKPIFAGWDPRNELKVRMSDLSNFKLSLSDSVIVDTAVVSTANGDSTVYDTLTWNDFPVARKFATRKLPNGSTLVVKGDPTISRVKYLKAGFRNRDPVQGMTGEIWLDELRVTDVEREIATAAVASANITLADVGRIDLTIDKRDADFHNAQTQFGSGSNSISASVSSNLNLDKFLPESWGLAIPVNGSYRFSERQPKYIPGTDIRVMDLDPSLRDTLNSITDLTTSYNWNMSLSKKVKSDFWLTRYTLDNLSFKLANNQNYSQSSQIAGKSTAATSGNIRYNLNFGKRFTIQPLRFMSGFPLVGGKISEFTLGYLPSSITMDANGAENQSNTKKRNKNADEISSHTLSLTRNVSVDWPIMPTLNARYSRKMDNNLDSLVNKKKEILETGNLGHLGTLQESYSLAWQPQFLKLFSPNVSYSSSYRANDAIAATTPGVDALVNVTASTSLNVRLSELLGLIYKPQDKPASGRPPQPSPRGKPTRSTRDEDQRQPSKAEEPEAETKTEKPRDEGPSLIKTVFSGIYKVVNKIDPISISVNNQQAQTRNKLVYDDSTEIAISDVDWRYKLGLTDSPGDFATSSLITTPGSENQSVNLSLRSGVKFTKDISAQLTFNTVQREDNSYGTQGVTNKISYDYLPSGPLFGEPDRDLTTLGKAGIPLPSFSIRWYGLEKVSLIKKFASSMYLESGYRGNQETSYQRGKEFNGQTITANFSPLLGVTMTIKPGINFSLNWNNTRNISNGAGGLTNIKMDQSITSNVGYSRRSGITIPLPMMDDWYLENNIDFSMSVTYSQSKTFQANPDDTGARLNIDPKDYSKQIIVNPNINYSFTDRITGRVGYNFTLTDNRISGTRTANKLEFGVRIIIKG